MPKVTACKTPGIHILLESADIRLAAISSVGLSHIVVQLQE